MSRISAIVVALLLVVLPLQGIAMVAKVQCDPTRAKTQSAAAHVPSEVHLHVHGVPHRHAGSAALAIAHAPQSSEPQAPAYEESPCASCGSCCAGAIIGTSPAITPPAFAAGTSFPSIVALYSDHVPKRLERPPHPLLV